MMDGQIYGVEWSGILDHRVEDEGSTGVWQPARNAGPGVGSKYPLMVEEPYLCYERNDVTSINPYKFFPDPRGPNGGG